LFCALAVFIQNGDAVTAPRAEKGGGTANAASTAGDHDESII
jgi:hypothetical protein